MSRRIPAVLLAIALLLPSAWVAWEARDMPHLGRLADDGVYWVTAKAIATGQGYRIISLPEQPYQTKYPPLYPALLSLVLMAAPQMAALFSWLMLPAFLAVAALYYRRMGFGPVQRWVVCALIATNVVVVHFMVYLMPELLFCALLLAAIVVADDATETGSVRAAATAGLIAAAAYLTKSAALPLLLCSPLLFLWRKRYRCAGAFAAAMLPFVLAWQFWCRTHRIHGGDDVTLFYTDYVAYQLYNVGLRDLPHVIWTNLRLLPSAMGSLLAFPASDSLFGAVLPRLIAVVAAVGVVRLAIERRVSHYHAFALGFVPQQLVWHYPPSTRFLLPIFALLLAGLVAEFARAAGWAARNFRMGTARALASAAAGMILLNLAACALITTFGAPLGFIVSELQARRREAAAMQDTYDWIVRTFPGSTPFVTGQSEAFYIRTGLRAVSMVPPPKFLYDRIDGLRLADQYRRSLAAFARARGIPYLLETRWDYQLDPLPERTRKFTLELLRDRTSFEPVYERPDAGVYRIAPLKAGPP
jgi:hypothetical protein